MGRRTFAEVAKQNTHAVGVRVSNIPVWTEKRSNAALGKDFWAVEFRIDNGPPQLFGYFLSEFDAKQAHDGAVRMLESLAFELKYPR